MQPDETDWKIIDILSKKHQPNNQIARELGLSEATVRRRIKNLHNAGIIKIYITVHVKTLNNFNFASINYINNRLVTNKSDSKYEYCLLF